MYLGHQAEENCDFNGPRKYFLACKRISSEFPTPERDIRFDFDSFPSLTKRTNSDSQRSNMDGNRYAPLNSDLVNRLINEDHSYASVAAKNLRRS